MQLYEWFKEKILIVEGLHPKVLIAEDIEDLHQYRVNLRRLEACCLVYAHKRNKKILQKILKTLIKPTSYARDLDLFLIEIQNIDCSSHTKEKLLDIYKKKKEKNDKELLKVLNSQSYKKNIKRLEKIINNDKSFLYITSKKRAYKEIKKQQKLVYKKFYKINVETPFEDIHIIRKDFKVYRYGIEIYKIFLQNQDINLNDLKHIQDVLGDLQDAYVRDSLVQNVKSMFEKQEYQELKDYYKIQLKQKKDNLLVLKNYLQKGNHLKQSV